MEKSNNDISLSNSNEDNIKDVSNKEEAKEIVELKKIYENIKLNDEKYKRISLVDIEKKLVNDEDLPDIIKYEDVPKENNIDLLSKMLNTGEKKPKKPWEINKINFEVEINVNNFISDINDQLKENDNIEIDINSNLNINDNINTN